MGYGSGILLFLLLIIIFTILSFHHHSHFQELVHHFNDGRNQNQEEHHGQPLFLQKFGTLLEHKYFKAKQTTRIPPFGGSPSPSPSPSIEAAPVPAPVHPLHVHSHHHPWHKHSWVPPAFKDEKNKGRIQRILVAVLVSAGATSILSLIGIFWGCRKFRKQRRKNKYSSSRMYANEAATSKSNSKYVNPQNSSVKKVNSDPGPDLFYLESLGTALAPPHYETLNTLSNQKMSVWESSEVEESKKIELDEQEQVSCSAVGEIVSVHDNVEESIKYEACNSGSQLVPGEPNYSSDDESVKYEDVEKVMPVEANYSSDDDESFHSFCNSHTSNPRLSNVSMGSLSDKSDIVSPNLSKTSPFPVPSPEKLPIPSLSPLPPPPPPPPPPPLPRVHISPSYSTSSSTRMKSKAFNHSALPNVSSPRNSDSSSGSNQTPKSILPISPPPPPKPPAGVPPPPCPPPFSKGSIKGGPPPPPFQFPQHTPLGKDGAPLPKLKPLHWDKVRAASDHSMVWDKLKSSSFEFDEEMIESLFGYNLQNSMKNEDGKSKSPSPSKHVLEPKRLQNITILSKALNVTAEQVCHALIRGNGLCLQQLEALSKMEPTKDEESKLTSFKGNSNELGSAEKFVTAMLKIPYAFQRIEAMLYRETFEDEVVHLRKSFSMLEEACQELRSSRLFLKLLEAVLKTGNRMNVGTIRGGAKAFKLDTLLKLSDVKGTDGKTTLLHFVVQEIVRSEGIRVSESIIGKINQKSRGNVEDSEEEYRRMGLELVAGLCTELCNVKKTATIDLDVLASSVSNLSDGLTKLKCLIDKDPSMDEKNGNFAHSMKAFQIYADRNLRELREDEHKVFVHVREITEYFHGNVSKEEANPLRIFVIVRDFLGMLDHVCRELRSLKVPSSPNPLAPFR